METLEFRDRRYRMKVYKDCFLASQAIDVLVDSGHAESREDAVRIGRDLDDHYNVFEHVMGDHLLTDDFLFFRFNNRGKLQKLLLAGVPDSVLDEQDEEQVDDEEWQDDEKQRVAEIISVVRSVKVKDRRYRLKVYKNSFVASQLIDLLVKHGCANTRQEAVLLGRRVNQRHNLFQHVTKAHALEDDYLFFRLTKSLLFLEQRVDSIRSLSRCSEMQPQRVSNCNSSFSTSVESDEDFEQEGRDYCFDNIEMLYPAFGNNHERVNQLIPACMGYQYRMLPYTVLDVLATMQNMLGHTDEDAKDNEDDDAQEHIARLSDLLYKIAFSCSRCKEQFQLMSTDRTKRTFNSKHISIRQTQPLANGVLVRRTKGGEPLPSKGTSGTQFPYFHILDWLLGRYQFGGDTGLIGKLSAVDKYYPRPQREYIRRLSRLHKCSTLRGFLDIIGRPPQVMVAYNHLIECYAGQGGVLTAHCRKLYSYMHNDVQFSTSGTQHAVPSSTTKNGNEEDDTAAAALAINKASNNHKFATMMFQAMSKATDERWRLRVGPLLTEVRKTVYSSSDSGRCTTVALDLQDTGLRYEYGDVVRVLLPNDKRTSTAWIKSLGTAGNDGKKQFLKLKDIQASDVKGWTWADLWEALGWSDNDENGRGVSLEKVVDYIEQAQIRDEEGKMRWVNSPLDLCDGGTSALFAVPPKIAYDQIRSCVPVSPRIYSVAGVEPCRVFLLVSKPQDGGRHHGYERMADRCVERVHCAFSPSTFFLVPPRDANLVCVASGTGISPFVGLADAIGSQHGMYTIVHQCKSSDIFLSNCQQWLDFTAINPGAVVMGYISGDRSRRNGPMRYVIRNGKIDETTLMSCRDSSCYYFECPRLVTRLKEVYRTNKSTNNPLNLAYCCGGIKSAIQPLEFVFNGNGWKYEFTVQSYAVTSLSKKKGSTSQIGGAVVNLDAVSPVHEGGDQSLHHIQQIALDEQRKKDQETSGCPKSAAATSFIPDHTDLFYQLHPHAYNLHRCLRAPFDADFEAFAAFLEQNKATERSMSFMASAAEKYAKVALSSPDYSKVVRIASELQSSSLSRQVRAGDHDGAKRSAEYLEALMDHVPSRDSEAARWNASLSEFSDSILENANEKNIDDDGDREPGISCP
jgi:hypothetical protein